MFDLLLCFDKNYIPHAATAAHSFLVFHSERIERVHLAVSVADSAVMEMSNFLETKHSVDVQVIEVPTPRVDQHGHVSNAAYLRLLAPGYMVPKSDWVIYIDSDTVTRKEFLSEASALIKESGRTFFAVRDSVVNRSQYPSAEIERYFNSGMMLFSYYWWSNYELSRKFAVHLESKARYKFWDQDILNLELNREWFDLPVHMNVQSPQTDVENISMLHFTGPEKPWHALFERRLREEYLHFRHQTPFTWKGPEIKLKNLLKLGWRRVKKSAPLSNFRAPGP